MIPPLHAITDDRVLRRRDFLGEAQAVLRAGGSSLALHLRGPGSPGAKIFELARVLQPTARRSGSTLLVNDRVDVARLLDLEGVQLGARSLDASVTRSLLDPDALVGVSVHGGEEAKGARVPGADFLLVGTIFSTASHPDRVPGGAALLREVRGVSGLPMVGIGGVAPGGVGEVLAAGAVGVAALSGIWDAERPSAAVGEYLREVTVG